jgi:toxin ParE1/3/4
VKIVWSPLAVDRVTEIVAWISRDRPVAAENLVQELFSSVEQLVSFPGRGRRVPEIDQPDIRELIHKRYRIIYRVKANSIEVLTVRHSRQDLEEEDLTG